MERRGTTQKKIGGGLKTGQWTKGDRTLDYSKRHSGGGMNK